MTEFERLAHDLARTIESTEFKQRQLAKSWAAIDTDLAQMQKAQARGERLQKAVAASKVELRGRLNAIKAKADKWFAEGRLPGPHADRIDALWRQRVATLTAEGHL
jgi:oligoendopeptidase F